MASLGLLSQKAPATIEEQRARLPPRAGCDDAVQGVWRSHSFYPRQRQWYVFLLSIRRAEGNALRGDIDVEAWDGAPSTSEPLPCTNGYVHHFVHQAAAGVLQDGHIDFHGTTWEPGKTLCGRPTPGYTLDTFLGVIDPALEEFQSVNRYPIDGQMVEDVTVFRRVQCVEEESAPARHASSPVTAPPKLPERRSGGGCGCRVPG